MYKYYQIEWFIQHLWEYILCTSINIRKTMDNPRLEHVKIPYHQRYRIEETTKTSVNSFSQSCQPSAEWIILYLEMLYINFSKDEFQSPSKLWPLQEQWKELQLRQVAQQPQDHSPLQLA